MALRVEQVDGTGGHRQRDAVAGHRVGVAGGLGDQRVATGGQAVFAVAGIEHFVTTSTIGIGDGYDERILDALAERGNGNHIAAIEQAEAVNALQAEIDDLLQKTMTDVRFEINLGPEVSGRRSRITPARPMRKFEARHGSARALLGDVASGEEKNVVFDLTIDVHELARPDWYRGIVVKYEYFDVLSGQTVTRTDEFKLEVVAKEHWIEPVRNEDIVAELKTVRLQAVRDQAIDLYRQGREAEARAAVDREALVASVREALART